MAFWSHETPQRPLPSRGEGFLVLCLLAVVCVAVYVTSLPNNFVTLDDGLLIYDNAVVKSPFSLSSVERIFTMYDPELYIPLTFMTFKLEHALFGLDATYYHLTNLLLHIGNAFLVYVLLFQLTSRRALAFSVSMLFALHPVNVEAVSWVAGRKDVLATFFALLSLVFYQRYRAEVKRFPYYVSVACFALSLLAKVSVILLPIVLLLLDWREKRRFRLHVLLEKLPYFALSTAFGLIALFGKTYALESTSTWQKILMAIKSSVFYLESFVMPVDLTAIYPYNGTITLLSPDFYLPLLVLVAIAAGVLVSLKWTRDVATCVVFFFLLLSPSFINFSKGGAIYVASDRYVYMAYLGLFALVVGAVLTYLDRHAGTRQARSREQAAVTVLVVILGIFSVLSFKQSLTWRDSETLYLQALKFYPDSFHAHNNLGSFYYNYMKDEKRAQEHFEKALTLKPHDPSILNNLAILARDQGDTQKAVRLHLQAAEEARKINPLNVDAYYSLASMFMQRNDTTNAINWFKKALELNPAHVPSLINLGAVYAQINQRHDAEDAYLRAIKVEPDLPQPYYNLGILLELDKRPQEAEIAYKKAISLDKEYLDAYNNLGALYFDANRLPDALHEFEKAYAIDPKNEMASRNLIMIRTMLRNQGSHSSQK